MGERQQHAEPWRGAGIEQESGESGGRGRGRQRPPQMRGVRIRRNQRIHAADLAETHEQQHRGTGQQHGHVHGFGPQHRLHAAEHHEHAGDDHEEERGEPEEIHFAEQRQRDVLVSEDRLDRERAGEDRHRRLGEDVAHEEDERQERARAGRVATLEEFRRGEDLRAQIERREDPAEHQHQVRVQLPMREGHAGFGAGAGEADQVLRADVRREDGGTDQEPAGVAAREEVVGRVLFFLHRAPDADRGVGDEVERDDRPVERGESNSGSGHGQPLSNSFGVFVSPHRRTRSNDAVRAFSVAEFSAALRAPCASA